VSVLAFHDLHKAYGETPALRGVSFEVGAGEVLGLLGPNGAGKTTLIRILMDILRPDAGSITLFGRPHDREALDRVGYLPEERGLYTRQRVRDVMTYFGALKGLSRKEAAARASRWLERVGLAETASWRIDRLSKGMGQKVQIASTLLPDTELCILDEPFSGLDPINVRLVQELIRERRAAGRTTVLSTHQMNMVEALCDSVALIHKGRLVLFGRTEEVRRRHSPRQVRVGLEGKLPALAGVAEAAGEGDGTFRLRLEEGRDPGDLLAELVRLGARPTLFQQVLAPMEEIFVRVVQEDRA
jgi:ABC-2 type transport system ATP-binding protein